MDKVNPKQLEAECDRAIYNMEVQFRMLGPDSLNTPKELLGGNKGFFVFFPKWSEPVDVSSRP